jgi:hypothetical protein
VPLELFDRSKMFLTRRTPGLNDLVFRAHERIQIVALYFFSDRAQRLRLLSLLRSGALSPLLVTHNHVLLQRLYNFFEDRLVIVGIFGPFRITTVLGNIHPFAPL